MSTHAPHSEGCRELVERLSEYLDGELDVELCSSVEGHLDDCPPCRAFLKSLRRTVAHIETLPAPGLPDEIRR